MKTGTRVKIVLPIWGWDVIGRTGTVCDEDPNYPGMFDVLLDNPPARMLRDSAAHSGGHIFACDTDIEILR